MNYHDEERGVPMYDDTKLFEFLVLEGAQAGLSWSTILAKRDGYKQAFFDFDVGACATLDDEYLESLCEDSRIIRNKLKIFSVRKNALVVKAIQSTYGSFSEYLWSWVDHAPVVNDIKVVEDVVSSTPLSENLSKDLKSKGMSFVGPTIMYAYLQAVGVIDDHLNSCYKKTTP